MTLCRSWRAGCAVAVVSALLTCVATVPGFAQEGDNPAEAPPAASHSETNSAPPVQQDQPGAASGPEAQTPAVAPVPRCRLRNNKKLDLIV